MSFVSRGHESDRVPTVVISTVGNGAGAIAEPVHEHHVEDGGEEQAEDGDADHAGEDGDAHGLAHFGAGTGRDDEGIYTGDEGDAGHQDRAEPEATGFEGGFGGRFAFVLLGLGELDDEDGVLARETDEHDEADLGEDVVVTSLDEDAEHGAEQAHGNDEDDGQRKGEAFVLGSEDEEGEQDAQGKHIDGGVAGDALLVGQFSPFEIHAGRHDLAENLLDGVFGLAGTEARAGIAAEFSRGITVVADDAVGSGDLTDPDQGAERNHLAGGIADLEPGDVGGFVAEGGIGLGDDLIGASEPVEVIDVK